MKTAMNSLLCLAIGLAGNAAGKEAVVGGKAVSITEAPWTIKLSVGCTGSWLGGRWAITAKHCVSGTVSYITAGITRQSEARTTSLRTSVRRVIRNSATDIALLELSQDVTAVDARPIRPATKQDADRGLTDPGKLGRLSGWGQLGQNSRSPDSLHMLDHRISTRGATSATYIYFGGAQNGTLMGSCYGDSGGPLAVRDATGTGWILAGVVSGGSSVCGDSQADHYGRVSEVESWIRQYTGGPVALGHEAPLDPQRITITPRGFRIQEAGSFTLTAWDLVGAEILRTRRNFPAGEHALSSIPGSAAVVAIAPEHGSGGIRMLLPARR